MKREELYVFGDDDDATYYKSEADAVMDAMEARIKELEKALENAVAGGEIIKGLCERHEVRIKELEAESKRFEQGRNDLQRLIIHKYNRIKELEAEVKKWKQDNRYLSALVRLLYKGKDANSTAVIAVANRMDELEAENERLKAIVGDGEYKQGLSGLAQRNAELREENAQLKAQVPK